MNAPIFYGHHFHSLSPSLGRESSFEQKKTYQFNPREMLLLFSAGPIKIMLNILWNSNDITRVLTDFFAQMNSKVHWTVNKMYSDLFFVGTVGQMDRALRKGNMLVLSIPKQDALWRHGLFLEH